MKHTFEFRCPISSVILQNTVSEHSSILYNISVTVIPAGTAPCKLESFVLNNNRSASFSLFDTSAALALKQKLSESFQGKDSPSIPLRAWVPDCGIGMQAYVAGMLLAESSQVLPVPVNIQVFATDRSDAAVKTARAGQYPLASFAPLHSELLTSYCRVVDDQVYIKQHLRERVIFSLLDVLRDPPLPHLDLIYAPNVLQGLKDDARAVVLAKFHFALRTGGILCTGADGSVDAGLNLFSALDSANGMYSANALFSPPLPRRTPVRQDIKHLGKSAIRSVDRLQNIQIAATPEARLHRTLTFQSLPPTILVDENFHIIHVSDGADQFLKPPSGNATSSIISLVHPSLRTSLRAALFKAAASNASVDVRHRGYAVNDWVSTVNMTVRPLTAENQSYILISFDTVAFSLDDADEVDHTETIAKLLDEEVTSLKRQLQETIDDARAAQNERKLANEEAQAINEELRSVVEEATASRETLLSENQALASTNCALTREITEANTANDDLVNFMTRATAFMIFIDENMLVRRYSQDAPSIYHLRSSDVGRSLLDIRHRLIWPGYEQDLHHVTATSPSIERELMHEDGRRFIVRISQFGKNGGLRCGAALAFTDITALRQAEANAAASEARLNLLEQAKNDEVTVLREHVPRAEHTERVGTEEGNRLKDQFLAIMSHELKHPLNLISVNADLLSRLPIAQSGGMTEQALANITQAVKSQAKIIDDLLDLSRINTGKLRLDVASVDVIATVGTIVTAAQEVAHAKGVTLSFKTNEPELIIGVDAVRFEQVLWNLITNSIKFTPTGGSIEVSLCCEQEDCVLRVTDTGIGISHADIGNVFSLFSQVEGSASSVMGGLGIGLALVKELVEAHGGRVQATSPGAGHGVTMTVWLPASLGGPACDTESGSETSTLAGVKVLIVDDAIEAGQALAALLETAGAQSRTAGSGEDALAMLKQDRFDVLVSDVVMPGMDGYELISRVRASGYVPDLPAIALSGFSGPAEDEKLKKAGFDRHLQKPASFTALQQGIVDTLAKKTSGTLEDVPFKRTPEGET